VLFEFDPAGGMLVPAAGAGGLTVVTGAPADGVGTAGALGVACCAVGCADAAVREGGLGM
jgi:hypothetical protein